ncbi:hypothetical protein [Cobetia sp. ICG0124]|uniref:hypothetical protein n=1 Tax=Cobetia sp. ICG0124 TaxID=2053669 RepID=UPI000FDBF1F7|nr:hypothetical protein [Cobetia sp. ICG0124]AZV32339.1 hypothetical protein CU110_14725 [Cobetia sp. ICG0124]
MRLSQRARQEIHQYGWPGNVRELENALERGVILADRRIIAPEDLGLRAASLDFSAESMPENTSQSLACESLR